jgi:hypothetical protein
MSLAPKVCVRCGVAFVTVRVPCPDARPDDTTSCLVLHWGLRCPQCGERVYEQRDAPRP